jgi:Pin2-interacting protein X1
LDYDPNNTRWTRDETTFGQKILRAHGWEPGKYLGSQEAGNAQLHSAASLAPIKINLKDDTLGLGAKIIQKQSDECTGLDVFKDLLGRLNGKSEETLTKERRLRSEIKTNLVIERKYGPMRFVSGGLLVGDQMQMAELVKDQPESKPVKDEPTSEDAESEPCKKEKETKSKKRKVSESEDVETSENKPEKKRNKRSKDKTPEDDAGVETSKKKKDRKDKKSKLAEKAVGGEGTPALEPELKRKKSKKSKDDSQSESSNEIFTEPSENTSEKAGKKGKKEKKDRKRKQEDGIESTVTTSKISTSTTTLASGDQESGSSTPQSTGTSTPQALSARHLARSRNIASKKMAFGDMQALNQVCKAPNPLIAYAY